MYTVDSIPFISYNLQTYITYFIARACVRLWIGEIQ